MMTLHGRSQEDTRRLTRMLKNLYQFSISYSYHTIQNFGGIKLWRISSQQVLADNILANSQTEKNTIKSLDGRRYIICRQTTAIT